MPEIAINVRGISKRFSLGPARAPLGFSALIGASERRTKRDEIWALKDVSFDVARGERVGIIGRNGAGKSTLLKILSRVTYPTEGEARIRGRVTSLLEVGTGFNDALSGRENIYLNAALHGLSRDETEQRIEDIIEFSEVRRFIDSPINHYSSGMRMRLAFSVAAHLDPDILMLDEVLAVGDLSFQKKCLERMNSLTSEGRTLLFVSHSIEAVSRFCERCIWLEEGRIRLDGPAKAVLSEYLKAARGLIPAFTTDAVEATAAPASDIDRKPDAPPSSSHSTSGRTELVAARMRSKSSVTATTFALDQPIGIEVTYRIKQPGRIVEPAIHVRAENQTLVFVAAYTDAARPESNSEPGEYRATAWIPANLLNTGPYYVSILLVTPDPLERHVTHENALSFYVLESAESSGTRGRYGRSFPGVVRPLLRWETVCLPSMLASGSDPAQVDD